VENGAPPENEHGRRFRRGGFLGALLGLFAVAAGKAQADSTLPAPQPGTYPLLVNADNFGQQRTALASPAADETFEVTNFGDGSALVAIAGGGATVAPPQNVTATASVMGWNAGVAAPGVGGGFFKTSGELPSAGLVAGLLQAGDTPDQFLSPTVQAAGVFTTGPPPPVPSGPTPATTTASVVGWNADVDTAGVAGGFFKTTGSEPSAGILVGLLQPGETGQLLPPVNAAGIFLDTVSGLGANAVTMTAAHFAFSESNTSSAAVTEEGTAIFAQVLGQSGTGGVFTQPSPGGDALVVDGRGVFSRSFQQTIEKREDSFTVLDAFVTPNTVAITNFTSDPRDVSIKMVTLNPGQSVVFTLNKRTERPITVNGVLFN
jgi:hypothetical protein